MLLPPCVPGTRPPHDYAIASRRCIRQHRSPSAGPVRAARLVNTRPLWQSRRTTWRSGLPAGRADRSISGLASQPAPRSGVVRVGLPRRDRVDSQAGWARRARERSEGIHTCRPPSSRNLAHTRCPSRPPWVCRRSRHLRFCESGTCKGAYPLTTPAHDHLTRPQTTHDPTNAGLPEPHPQQHAPRPEPGWLTRRTHEAQPPAAPDRSTRDHSADPIRAPAADPQRPHFRGQRQSPGLPATAPRDRRTGDSNTPLQHPTWQERSQGHVSCSEQPRARLRSHTITLVQMSEPETARCDTNTHHQHASPDAPTPTRGRRTPSRPDHRTDRRTSGSGTARPTQRPEARRANWSDEQQARTNDRKERPRNRDAGVFGPSAHRRHLHFVVGTTGARVVSEPPSTR